MASYTLNEAAVAHARRLIDARQYVLDSDWGDVQPRADDQNRFLESHSWDDYAAWHLGLTEGAPDETKGRYAFVYGDLRPRPPNWTDRLRVSGRGMATQGGRARCPRPTSTPRPHLSVTCPPECLTGLHQQPKHPGSDHCATTNGVLQNGGTERRWSAADECARTASTCARDPAIGDTF